MAANNTSRVPLLLISIKLTAVMGLTWILTLLANWKQTAFLEYPSTVLNSMQGNMSVCHRQFPSLELKGLFFYGL